MRAILTTWIVVLLIGALSLRDEPSSASTSPDPLDLFNRYVAAINASDLNAGLSLFADDATLTPGGPGGGGRCPGGACIGKDAIRGQLQGQIGDQHKITLLRGQTSADGIAAAGTYALSSRQTAAAGVDRIVFNFQLAEASGLIAKLTFSPDLNDPTTAAFFQRRAAPMQPPQTGEAGLARQ